MESVIAKAARRVATPCRLLKRVRCFVPDCPKPCPHVPCLQPPWFDNLKGDSGLSVFQLRECVEVVVNIPFASRSLGSVSLLLNKPPRRVQRFVSCKSVSESRGGCASKSKSGRASDSSTFVPFQKSHTAKTLLWVSENRSKKWQVPCQSSVQIERKGLGPRRKMCWKTRRFSRWSRVAMANLYRQRPSQTTALWIGWRTKKVSGMPERSDSGSTFKKEVMTLLQDVQLSFTCGKSTWGFAFTNLCPPNMHQHGATSVLIFHATSAIWTSFFMLFLQRHTTNFAIHTFGNSNANPSMVTATGERQG